MNKPPFDPNQPFQSMDEKPPFDPNQPFQEASPQNQDQGGFLHNAWGDIKGIGETVRRTAQGVVDLPSDIYQSGKQVLSGQDYNQTPLMQDMRTVGGGITNALPHVNIDPQHPLDVSQYQFEPGTMAKQYQEIGAQPLKYIPGQVGQEFQKAYPENPFTQHPVNTGLALAPLAKPLFQAASEIPGAETAMNATREAVASPFQSSAQNFGRRALGLTKRFLNKTEDQLPQANQAAQTALDTGVIQNPIFHPFSSGAEDMMNRAQNLDTAAGQRIGSFLKSQGEKFDWGQTLSDLEGLKRRFPADESVLNQINNAKDMIRRTAIRYGGDIPFDEANKIKSFIQKKINWQSDKATAEVGQQIAGTVRGSMDSQLKDLADQGGTGENFQNFLQNKKLFGQSNIMQKGLLNKAAAESGNYAVSPYSLITGATEMAHSGNIFKSLMIAGGTELAKRYGAATAATLSNSLAKMIMANPGKYSSLLSDAMSTGAPTLDALSEALKNDPEFQALTPNKQPKPLFRNPVPPKAAQMPSRNTNEQLAMGRLSEPQDPEKPIVAAPRGVREESKKYLDKSTARVYLNRAEGDKVLARNMAQDDGYTIV